MLKQLFMVRKLPYIIKALCLKVNISIKYPQILSGDIILGGNMGLVDRMKYENREKVFKELLGKKYSSLEDFDIRYEPMEEFLLIDIKRLVLEGNINRAEDTLFSAIDKNKSLNNMFIAGEFYTMLMDMTDDELKEANFSRREVLSGLQEIKEIYSGYLKELDNLPK